MSLRFRKSFKFAPGLRLNVGKKSMGMSLGPRGASVSVGSRGVYSNLGIPGTGISLRSRVGGAPPRRAKRPEARKRQVQVTAKVVMEDNGQVVLKDENGAPCIRISKTHSSARTRMPFATSFSHGPRSLTRR